MRRVSKVLILSALLVTGACSKSGKGGTGSPDDYDAVGEGNIPIAEPGQELSDVRFEFDSSTLSPAARETLRRNSRWLLDNPDRTVRIEGHCDERGTAEYNMALGLRRAESVQNFIRSLGVKDSKLETISYGEELPLDPSSNESAWMKNRRAHFAIK